jgi:hypothetical protein
MITDRARRKSTEINEEKVQVEDRVVCLTADDADLHRIMKNELLPQRDTEIAEVYDSRSN